MLRGNLYRIGDRVAVTIDKDRRSWSKPKDFPFEDGATGTVCGFGDAIIFEPRWGNASAKFAGVYHAPGATKVLLDNGFVCEHLNEVLDIELLDTEEFTRRRTAPLAPKSKHPYHEDYTFLGELPETKFWEGDLVSCPDISKIFDKAGPFRIQSIDYNHLHSYCNDEVTPYPIYTIDLEPGTTAAHEDQLVLLERGNLWKYHHDEPLSFESLREELSFHHNIGRTEEVRNPETGVYSWTVEEALRAIDQGIAHGITHASLPFVSGTCLSLYRCEDEDLGLRAAFETLEGFKERMTR